MNQLFEALRARHAGYEVVDFRLLANLQEINGRSAADLDVEFAAAINAAELQQMPNA